MKHWLLPVCLLPITGLAQDYQTVRSDFVHFFADEHGNSHGIKIDSIITQGGDSILHNYLVLRSDDFLQTFKAYVPSWLGERVIVKSNGDNLFFNSIGDTILIKTQAQLLDSWQLIGLDSATFLEARIEGIGNQMVLDSLDEIKIIGLQAKDSQGFSIAHPLNDKTIAISKSFGILLGFDFYHFPEDTAQMELVGMENPDMGIYRLTWDKIYDFQIGDEFHYWREDGDPILERRIQIVAEVHNGSNTRTVEFDVYKLDMWFNGPPGPTTQVFESSSFEMIKHYNGLNQRSVLMPNAAIAFDSVPYTLGQDSVFSGLYINSIQNHLSGRLGVYMNANSAIYALDSIGCYYEYPTISGGTTEVRTFAHAIGQTYWDYWSSDGLYWTEGEERLVYYKKGNEEWGTPYSMSFITDIEDSKNQTKSSIFPNPIRQRDLLDLGAKYNRVDVVDVNGKTVFTKTNCSTVETQGISPGIYFIKTTSETYSAVQRLIVTD